ncbi:MAG: hypothetical protein HZA31_08420 [Opitutae bacterium]|nr:hypothetical protein [Opitutae bacterium]
MNLDTSLLPVGPRLIDTLTEERGGVDYLNLRQVNLDLMVACIPGQNNVTSNVRSYSVMCWIYWKIFEETERRKKRNTSTEEIRVFREKVESYFLWGHLQNQVGGVAGTRSRPPNNGRGKVSLQFADWKRSADNTSIQAAVRYGPSLTELGLLEKSAPGVYHVTETGEALAAALDQQLRKSTAYDKLSDLSTDTGTLAEAEALFPFWRSDRTSRPEQIAMQAVLFDFQQIDDIRSPMGRRSAFIYAITQVLQSNRSPLSLEEIRDGLAYRRTRKGGSIDLPPGPREVTDYWFILQSRQLQRIALEVAMGWMEEKMQGDDCASIEDVVRAATKLLTKPPKIQDSSPLLALVRSSARLISTEQEFFVAIDDDPERHDLQSVASCIVDLLGESFDEAFRESMRALFLLSNCDAWLRSDSRYKDLILRGGAMRISLRYWSETVAKFQHAPISDFLRYFFESLIFSQHLAVATNRFDGESSRLRFTFGEEGLESLVDEPWRPGITFDHLYALLQLLVSSGVLMIDDKERYECVSG